MEQPMMKIAAADTGEGRDRRIHRRHEMDHHGISVDRWDGSRRSSQAFGRIVDLSAGGVRIRTNSTNVKADHHIRLRLELPEYAAISPFIGIASENPTPKREWIGRMAVSRVKNVNGNEVEVAGRLIDMDEMDRGMIG